MRDFLLLRKLYIVYKHSSSVTTGTKSGNFSPILSLGFSSDVDVDAGHAWSPLNPDSHQHPVEPGIGWNWTEVRWNQHSGSGSYFAILDLGFDEWWRV